MKTLKNLLKPRNLLIGAAAFLSSCGADYSFDLSRLEPWQRPLFLSSGDPWGIVLGRDDHSENKVTFEKLPHDTLAQAQTIYHHVSDKELFSKNKTDFKYFKIKFDKDVVWIDCSLEGSNGYDFKRVSIHEVGHIVGRDHSKDKESVMYRSSDSGCNNTDDNPNSIKYID